MKLNDKYNIDDSFKIIGHVKMVNNIDGTIVFDKHNMVVNAGRNLMFNLFKIKTGISSDNITTEKITIKFGSNNSATTGDMIELKSNVVNYNYDKTDNNLTTDDDLRTLTFTLPIIFNNEAAILSELGIFIGETMFSRVAFDPIPVGQDSNFTLTYTLYF